MDSAFAPAFVSRATRLPSAARGEPKAASRLAITRLVLEELALSQPAARRTLTPGMTLAEAGVGPIRFLDAINRIEGRYQMRFREEWLEGIVTVGDLIECIAVRMFDSADQQRTATGLPHHAAAEGHKGHAVQKFQKEKGLEDHGGHVFPECIALEERLRGLEAAGLDNPFLFANERVENRVARIGGRDVISFTSFDYLGLAGHPEVTRAAKAAIDQFGCSASASRMVGGNNTILDELDAELARFLGTERAVVFPCGYGTNASVFNHLFGEGDLILYDELAHNSIMQGANASKAGRRSFRHNDHEQLDSLLRDLRPQYRRVVVAIEGVYSMDGDYPDLPKFIAAKKRHDALLYVDEAHSLGTMGPGGRGICDFFGVDGLRVIQREPWRVTRLRERSELFLKLANDCNLDTGSSCDTPVIPVILGSSSRAILVSQMLLERGINARPILYPAVREVAARVRFFLTAEHTEEQIIHTVEMLAQVVAATAG